jgi:transposase
MLSYSSMNLGYEELLTEIRLLRSEVASLKVENTRLHEENSKLSAENTKLKEQLNLNSKNSSKPPSTDQKCNNDVPKKKGGAKPGHPGHFRSLFSADQVDAFVNLQAENCPSCGGVVQPSDEPPSIHQQVEIASKPYIVTQYNREIFYCPCCRKYGAAPLPSHIGPSAFGTRLSAFMGFLTGTCRLSRRIALSILKEGLDLRAAVGTQSNVENRIAAALKPSYEEIEKQVRESNETKHVDETGWKRWGKREFVWIMSTASGAVYKIQEGRSSEYRDVLLGTAVTKRAAFVTDRLAIYRFHGPHQYCLAHLKRDIKRFAERAGLDGEWGQVMLEYLKTIFELWRDYREKRRSSRSFRRASRRYRDDFEYGLLVASTKGKHSPSLKRFTRALLRRAENLWVFATRDGVEPTNNQAERDLRGIVITRRISYGSKSERGDQFVERINSVVTTLKRQGKKCLDYLAEALGAWKTGSVTPTIFSGSC